MWKEFLEADTYAAGPGSTVARVIDGSVHGYARTGIAGVANTGTDRNWTGHHFAQANWYAYGRSPGTRARRRHHRRRVDPDDVGPRAAASWRRSATCCSSRARRS
jgi:hypothetical protein